MQAAEQQSPPAVQRSPSGRQPLMQRKASQRRPEQQSEETRHTPSVATGLHAHAPSTQPKEQHSESAPHAAPKSRQPRLGPLPQKHPAQDNANNPKTKTRKGAP